MIKKTFIIIVSATYFGACSSTPEDYMHKSEYDLCVDYLSMAGNIPNPIIRGNKRLG